MGNITNPQQLGVRQQLGASGGAFIDVSDSVLNVEIANGLKDNGSNRIAVEPSDFAGDFISDDGTDLLQVDIGTGLVGDGTGSIEFDQDSSFTFSSAQVFNDGLEVGGDGVKIYYGTNLDMSTRYDAGDDDLKWRDEANTTDRMALDRTSGDLTISGTFDETSSP